MPLISNTISVAIQNQFALRKMRGRNVMDISAAIGSAVSQYFMVPNKISCFLNGVAGPIGNVNSLAVVGLVPGAMSTMMFNMAMSKKMSGRDLRAIFDSVSVGLSQVFMTMYVSGAAAGIGTGGGIGRFNLLNEKVLSKLLFSYMQSRKINGRDTLALCDSISFGIVNHLRTSVTITLTVVGAVSPVGPIPVVGIPAVYTKIT